MLTHTSFRVIRDYWRKSFSMSYVQVVCLWDRDMRSGFCQLLFISIVNVILIAIIIYITGCKLFLLIWIGIIERLFISTVFINFSIKKKVRTFLSYFDFIFKRGFNQISKSNWIFYKGFHEKFFNCSTKI